MVPGYEITNIVGLVDTDIEAIEVSRLLAENMIRPAREDLVGILGIIPAPSPAGTATGLRTIGTLVVLKELEEEDEEEEEDVRFAKPLDIDLPEIPREPFEFPNVSDLIDKHFRVDEDDKR